MDNNANNTGDGAKYQRLLLTGSSGGLGKVLRPRMAAFAEIVRVSDLATVLTAVLTTSAAPHEEIRPCDLADRAAVDALVADCDAIVHLGGVSVERPFEEILETNIKGVFHVYEAARRHGVKRVIFASSNHVTGFYRQDQVINTHDLRRPDGYYGLSKSYGEDMAQLYFDRYGIETVSIRIGNSFPQAKDRRALACWLSYDDLTELLRCSLFTPQVGHTVVYGVSDNSATWWNNQHAAHLGFVARDSSEQFRAAIETQPMSAMDDPVRVFQGGVFTVTGPFETQ
ncbi:MAG: NAD(P)-dependent oxidoreductase [Glaciimonas sp.]|nr:NAD(P)-dependent oxidoreductase [Glaciimonas sp.]